MVLPLDVRTSPGTPITRFTRSATLSLQSLATAAGALKTTMSPVLMVPKSTLSLSTMMRSPTCSVGYIEPDGTKYVSNTKGRTSTEMSTTATRMTSHSTMARLRPLVGRDDVVDGESDI